MNPDILVPIRYKLKEHHLRDYLTEKFDNIKIRFDRILGGCSARRPDVFIECFTHGLVVECDEHQHNGYSCENKRTMEIFQDLGCRPLVMIRFNPDKYIDANGKKIVGCFKNNNTIGIKISQKEWVRRTKILGKKIEKYMNVIPSQEVKIIQLFYDGF